ncbi:MAG: hypothetical protein KatS3mg002_0392 [Candidatus Woesearchaeota archaeon]|nr:MAG: hypothetical protein KatS3mg002_0392 [Candidatus Woesearchaeota archaeon]
MSGQRDFLAVKEGLPRKPSYKDHRIDTGRVTFSRAFIKAWLEGYDAAMEELNKINEG